MKVLPLHLSFLFVSLIVLCGINTFAQSAPICDVICSPDPGSSGYGSVASARPKLLNARGYSSSITPKAAPFGMQASIVQANGNNTNIGSQSYNYEIRSEERRVGKECRYR